MLFIICALLPIISLSLISYFQVSRELTTQNAKRLQSAAKSYGMTVYERFLYLENNLRLINMKNGYSDSLTTNLLENFRAMGFIDEKGNVEPLLGEFSPLPSALFTRIERMSEARTAIYFDIASEEREAQVRIYMMVKEDSSAGIEKGRTLVGEIKPLHLWGIGHENILPPMTDLCIMDQYKKILVSSFAVKDDFINHLTRSGSDSTSRVFSYRSEDEDYFISHWSLFLRSKFDAPVLTVVLRNQQSQILTALSNFKLIFFLVILLSVWVVMFLSLVLIRRSLVPLEEIRQGTIRVANRNFDQPVKVGSRDEFEEVANSFNSMVDELHHQFEDLHTRSKIDREILSSLNKREIVNKSLRWFFHFFHCDSAGVCLQMSRKRDTFESFLLFELRMRRPHELYLTFLPEDIKEFISVGDALIIEGERLNRRVTSNVGSFFDEHILLLPMVLEGQLKGIIVLGYKEERKFEDNELQHARQIANQVTVALANSSTVDELEKLNRGTLEALARTVDAKSAWTAGHSERVMDLSMKIAGVLGLGKDETDVLQRAAYLHDIGKIGIPLAILDKPARLTDEEYAMVMDHPSIGAKILEPIAAYEEAIPIVHQHHEKYDGTGYPLKLSGEEICLGARILAVADVYDAVASDRPYREGWVREKAVKLITDNSGSHFDPKIVDAFLAII